MKTIEMELAVSAYFNPRQNLSIPNVSWGFNIHECDLLILTKTRYLYEIEIKVSRSDLIKDKEKRHNHQNNKIKRFYFAIPEEMEKDIEHIPERAGILIVYKAKNGRICCKKLRESKINTLSTPVNDDDAYKLARLGALRIWALKKRILKIIKCKERKKRKLIADKS